LANRFTGSKSVVYTLYNRLEAPCEGVLLGIPDPENAVSVEKIAGNGEANFESGMIKGKVPAKQVLALKVVYSKMPVLKFSWSSDKKGLSLSGANDEKKKREKENGRAEAAID
jgi:hypothetical protein